MGVGGLGVSEQQGGQETELRVKAFEYVLIHRSSKGGAQKGIECVLIHRGLQRAVLVNGLTSMR